MNRSELWTRRGLALVALSLVFALQVGCKSSSDDDDDDDDSNSRKTFRAASIVIGQSSFSGGNPNRGGSVDAGTLATPLGRVTEGSLYVPDFSNHRVLGYRDIPTAQGETADFVLGQVDFVQNSPGVGASRFTLPTDSWTDGTRLFVVDMANNRVLIWNSKPTTNRPADVVLGQTDFTGDAPGTSASRLWQPVAVAVAGQKLLVVDQGNHRVLVWNSIPTVNGAAASMVLGQSSFTSNGSATTANGMFAPSGVWSDGQRLLVADTGNHRVLLWNSFPSTSGAAAHVVFGQAGFTTGFLSSGASGLRSPLGVHSDGFKVFIADSGNNRVLVFRSFPLLNQPNADIILGQRDFNRSTANDDNQDGKVDTHPTARTLSMPSAVYTRGSQLFVTDRNNHRILIFEKP